MVNCGVIDAVDSTHNNQHHSASLFLITAFIEQECSGFKYYVFYLRHDTA